MTSVVYLDYNATAPVRAEAAAAAAAALATCGNPSSVHGPGRAARKRMEEAREAVSALAGASAADVVFTSGGTEANALALNRPGARILVSAVEHDSVLQNAVGAATIPVDRHGVVDLAALEALLAGAPGGDRLVSVMLANNETGVIQPVAEVAAVARRHGALVHCDAVQAAGKIAVDMCELGVDLLTLSAHKIGGPQGVGALVLRDGIGLTPLLRGGGQERRRRAGTENVAGIAGFGAAAAVAQGALRGDGPARIARLRDRLEHELRRAAPQAVIHGEGAARLPNTSCIGLPGVAAETQVMALDLAGIAVSSGAACSSGKVRPSHVLIAMGLSDRDAPCAIRVSLGWDSSDGDVDRFIAAWRSLAMRHGLVAA